MLTMYTFLNSPARTSLTKSNELEGQIHEKLTEEVDRTEKEVDRITLQPSET